MSLLSVATNRPLRRANPWLFAAANPVFSRLKMTRRLGPFPLPKELHGPVRRAVVDHDDLEVSVSLAIETFKACVEKRQTVPVHDDHGDRRGLIDPLSRLLAMERSLPSAP